jgi:hypothetical protein
MQLLPLNLCPRCISYFALSVLLLPPPPLFLGLQITHKQTYIQSSVVHITKEYKNKNELPILDTPRCSRL